MQIQKVNYVELDKIAPPVGRSLSWVCTVYLDLSVQTYKTASTLPILAHAKRGSHTERVISLVASTSRTIGGAEFL